MITGVWLADFLLGVLAWLAVSVILAPMLGRYLRGPDDNEGA